MPIAGTQRGINQCHRPCSQRTCRRLVPWQIYLDLINEPISAVFSQRLYMCTHSQLGRLFRSGFRPQIGRKKGRRPSRYCCYYCRKPQSFEVEVINLSAPAQLNRDTYSDTGIVESSLKYDKLVAALAVYRGDSDKLTIPVEGFSHSKEGRGDEERLGEIHKVVWRL